MPRLSARRALVLAALASSAALAVPALVVTGASSLRTSTPPAVALTGESGMEVAPAVSVYLAERRDHDLGPVPGTLLLGVTLSLRERNQALLDQLLARGVGVGPARWARVFGPALAQVALVRRALARAGLRTSWAPGQVLLTVRAPAAPIERFFHVQVRDFEAADGARFYAPRYPPAVPAQMSAEVVALTGLDDYPAPAPTLVAAVQGAYGVTSAQMTDFYDMAPLRDAGLDGTGETVMFPEAAIPSSAELQSFATNFHLPAFKLTVVSDPDAWGSGVTPTSRYYRLYATEAALDLEVVHGLAPGAKEVVYESSMGQEIPGLLEAMVTQRPTAILSSSWGMDNCAADGGDKQDALAENAVFEMAAAQGTSIMWATGDRGAYGCLYDGDPATAAELSVPADDNSPYITDVGGTLALLSTTGAYYKEAAWGEPMEQWGGTGGFSPYFSRPVWQYGRGLAGMKTRGIPDVSADADSNTGWDIFGPGPNNQPVQEPIGGTSAAAPCWAAVTALIDEFLAHQHLPGVGFADPTFYYFASTPTGLPAPAFHDVTEGTNLYYAATPGWDAATGLGSPDVAHLADDFEWYYRTHQHATQ